MRTRGISVMIGAALLLPGIVIATPTWGQGAATATLPPPPKPPNFRTLFPNPTNNNGYEEWVQAADLIRNNAKLEALAAEPNPTLSFRRKVLDDPDVMQALQLIRAGLNKPVLSPRTDLDENTPLPELSLFRQLARLLVTEQYVAFADGRVDAAINSMRVGLAFGYRIQTDTIISGLVGVAIDTMVLKEFSRHLDQLSVHHCDEVRRIVEDFLGAENPAARLLALEKGYTLKILEARRSNPNGLLDLLKNIGGEDEQTPNPDWATIQAHLKDHPDDVNALIGDAQDRVSALFDQALNNMRLPAAQRKPLAMDQAASPGAALFRLMSADPQQILDKYTRDQTQLRLLGVDVLIHRFRWDRNTLPNSLTELHAPTLVRDMFTGSEVVYTRDGDHYTLTSRKSASSL